MRNFFLSSSISGLLDYDFFVDVSTASATGTDDGIESSGAMRLAFFLSIFSYFLSSFCSLFFSRSIFSLALSDKKYSPVII